jgi:hypothetical protein
MILIICGYMSVTTVTIGAHMSDLDKNTTYIENNIKLNREVKNGVVYYKVDRPAEEKDEQMEEDEMEDDANYAYVTEDDYDYVLAAKIARAKAAKDANAKTAAKKPEVNSKPLDTSTKNKITQLGKLIAPIDSLIDYVYHNKPLSEGFEKPNHSKFMSDDSEWIKICNDRRKAQEEQHKKNLDQYEELIAATKVAKQEVAKKV